MTPDYSEPLVHIGNGVDRLTKALADRKWDEAEEIAQRMHAELVKVRAWINWKLRNEGGATLVVDQGR